MDPQFPPPFATTAQESCSSSSTGHSGQHLPFVHICSHVFNDSCRFIYGVTCTSLQATSECFNCVVYTFLGLFWCHLKARIGPLRRAHASPGCKTIFGFLDCNAWGPWTQALLVPHAIVCRENSSSNNATEVKKLSKYTQWPASKTLAS